MKPTHQRNTILNTINMPLHGRCGIVTPPYDQMNWRLIVA
jgi:hypothetical protein